MSAVVVLHPAWIARVPVEEVARVLMTWDCWLAIGQDANGHARFYAEPVPLLNITPTRSERA